MSPKFQTPLGIAFCAVIALSCGKKEEAKTTTPDNSEVAQSVGDTMAGVDESGGSGGTIGMQMELQEAKRLYAKYLPLDSFLMRLNGWTSNQAEAASCLLVGFGSCSSNTMTRTFGDCTLGTLTFSGTVSLVWGGSSSSCGLSAAGDSITRSPNFTITGPTGGTFAVSKTATIGQKVTWSTGSGTTRVFSFSNDGIRRVVKNSSGTTLYDFTTVTTSDITVTGTLRSNRTMSGGSMKITNNTSGVTCDLVPSNVTWASTCTCAVSGSFNGSCSNGSSVTTEILSCGTVKLTVGTDVQTVTLDRCVGT